VRKPNHLLDVNVLLALTDEGYVDHPAVMRWFSTPGLDWGMCAFSEAGFLRLSANPSMGKLTLSEATGILAALIKRPGFRYWPITDNWKTLAAPFGGRVFGHQQIKDAYLLGLAVKEGGILVTLDKAIRYMAGPRYGKNLLVLE
jgi:toxin-antitoxin system PIN domain toxin